MIKLNQFGGSPIWVNPSYIASIGYAKDGARVYVANDSVPLITKETPEEILKLIAEVNGCD